jgi:hypothetical protein
MRPIAPIAPTAKAVPALAPACAVAIALVLAGCASAPLPPWQQPAPAPAGRPAAPGAAGVPAAPPTRAEPTPARTANYRCDDGEPAELRFFPQQGVAVLVRGEQRWELQQQPAASGFAYGTAPVALRGRGDQLRIDVGRRLPITCVAVGG